MDQNTKPVELRDYTREGHHAKYYSLSQMGNFAYSHKSDLNDWLEIDLDAKTGETVDLNSYTLKSWVIKEAALKHKY